MNMCEELEGQELQKHKEKDEDKEIIGNEDEAEQKYRAICKKNKEEGKTIKEIDRLQEENEWKKKEMKMKKQQ